MSYLKLVPFSIDEAIIMVIIDYELVKTDNEFSKKKKLTIIEFNYEFPKLVLVEIHREFCKNKRTVKIDYKLL